MLLQRLPLSKVFTERPAPLTFILPGLLAGTTGLLIGPGGVSKSMLAMQTALSLSMGRDLWHLWGDGGATLPQGRVVLLNLEDPPAILEHRLHDIGEALRPDEHAAVDENLDVMPLYGTGFSIAQKDPRSGLIVASPYMLEVLEFCRGAMLVVIDTFNRSLSGLDENSNTDVGAVLAIVEAMCRQTGCAVLILHHMSKGGALNTPDAQQSSRGASALTDNARFQLNLTTMSKDEAKARRVDDEERRRWVQMDLSKVNYAPPQAPRWFYRGRGGVLEGQQQPPAVQKSSSSRRRADDDE